MPALPFPLHPGQPAWRRGRTGIPAGGGVRGDPSLRQAAIAEPVRHPPARLQLPHPPAHPDCPDGRWGLSAGLAGVIGVSACALPARARGPPWQGHWPVAGHPAAGWKDHDRGPQAGAETRASSRTAQSRSASSRGGSSRHTRPRSPGTPGQRRAGTVHRSPPTPRAAEPPDPRGLREIGQCHCSRPDRRLLARRE